MSELRTLAIRVMPRPGESLDSWLEALARRSWTSLSALLDALGLPEVPARERTSRLITSLPGRALRRLEQQVTLPARCLDTAVLPAEIFGLRAPSWRFCPQCLRDSEGRWPTLWWLPWAFACTKHHTLLHRVCPSCGREPRYFLPRAVHLHPRGHCMRRTGRRNVCGADLSRAPQLSLGHGHPIVQSQTEINGITLHPFTSADDVFVEADRLLSTLAESLQPSDLRRMSTDCRSAWEAAFTDATKSKSPLGSWRFHERRVRILTPEFLQREYTEGGKSLAILAREVGMPIAHVVRHAKSLGVTIHRGGIRPPTFNDKWLREQYVTQKRTGRDIAQEVGTHRDAVHRRLEQLGIPRRPSGRSSPALITKLDTSIPPDIRAAAEETLHGWRRLRRFQISIFFPTLTSSANYLGLQPGTLTMQLDQLECAVGAELFHRSVRHSPQHPTRRGTRLLRDLDREDVRKLMHDELGSRIEKNPGQDAISAAIAAADGERGALTNLHADAQDNGQLHIPPPTLPLLRHLFAQRDQENCLAQIQAATGMPTNTIFKQLKRLEGAGWLTSRRETPTERARGRRGRTYYSLTPIARRLQPSLTQLTETK
ncbi:TniQ family protein [Streptomyces sp. NPDC018000]|uniref:TniQ family protein n=1 Tax=Streptomyces sp. NPDC018000 TaxID=3365028 RepID=UPI00378899FF